MHHCLLYYQFFLLFLLTHFPQTEPAEYVCFFLFYTPLSLFSTNLKVVTQVTSLHISQSEGLTTLQQNWVVGNALLWQLLFAGPWGRELLFFFSCLHSFSSALALPLPSPSSSSSLCFSRSLSIDLSLLHSPLLSLFPLS